MPASDPTAVPDGAPDERVDALYGLPLDEFTASRDALAKELREAGEREQSSWVKGLRKPSAAAWLVNQLARTQRREARALLAAGKRLREAHERLLSGQGSRDELRKAAEREAKAVRELGASASGLLDSEGRGPSGASLEKAVQTLHAVALDEGTREAFAAGRLTRESRGTGVAAFGGAAPGGTGAAAAAPSGRRAARKDSARAALKEAKAEQRKRGRAVTAAERDVERARRDAERAQRRLEEATATLQRARAEEADADARVVDAEREQKRAS